MTEGRVRERLWRATGLAVAALGSIELLLAGHHRSSVPLVFGWSLAYVLGVLLPIAVAPGALTLAAFRMSRSDGRGQAETALAAVALFVAIALAMRGPTFHVRAFGAGVALMALLLLVARVLQRRALVLTVTEVALFCALAFSLELPVLLERRQVSPLRLRSWTSVFSFVLPRVPPFTGSGGRFEPALWCRIDVPPWVDRWGAAFRTNSMGFRTDEEPNFQLGEAPGPVLSLGDSFSNGFGVGQGEFLGPLLQAHLRRSTGDRTLQVLSAEISDPAHGLYYLQRFGKSVRPRVVILGLCGNDLMQNLIAFSEKGPFLLGREGRVLPRFGGRQENSLPEATLNPARFSIQEWAAYAYPGSVGSVEIDSRPPVSVKVPGLLRDLAEFRLTAWVIREALRTKWEREAKRGEVVGSLLDEVEAADGRKRLLDGVSNLGFYYRRPPPPVEEMYRAFASTVVALKSAARVAGAPLMLVNFPQRYQVLPQDWDATCARWRLNPADFDLEAYNRRLASECHAAGVPLLDLTDRFRREAPERRLFLPGDWHPSAEGHRIAADEVAGFLQREGVVAGESARKGTSNRGRRELAGGQTELVARGPQVQPGAEGSH